MWSRRTARRERGAPVGIGIAGCGNAAEVLHLPALERLGVPVAALADPDASALERLGSRFGVSRRHEDALALVDDPAVEAIAVLTPPEVRTQIVVPALEAGKHVLVEKPLALTIADCDRMVEAAALRPRTRAMIGFAMRFHRLVGAARAALASGAVGEVRAIATTNFGPTTELAPGRQLSAWRTDRERGGGTLFDKGVHHYDLWRLLGGGTVEEVWATANEQGQRDSSSVVTARLSGDVLASMALMASEVASNEVVVLGSGGRLDVDLYRFDGLGMRPGQLLPGSPRARVAEARRTMAQLPHGVRTLRAGGDYPLAYAAEWRHFLQRIRDDAPLECSLADGREVTRVALAAIESVRTGGAGVQPGAPAAVSS